jgi:hypothetical protein
LEKLQLIGGKQLILNYPFGAGSQERLPTPVAPLRGMVGPAGSCHLGDSCHPQICGVEGAFLSEKNWQRAPGLHIALVQNSSGESRLRLLRIPHLIGRSLIE